LPADTCTDPYRFIPKFMLDQDKGRRQTYSYNYDLSTCREHHVRYYQTITGLDHVIGWHPEQSGQLCGFGELHFPTPPQHEGDGGGIQPHEAGQPSLRQLPLGESIAEPFRVHGGPRVGRIRLLRVITAPLRVLQAR
jgi:hypothetical protein